MPIDQAMSDAMLGSFRDMLKGLEGRSGEHVDTMTATLSEMETLAAEMDDLAAFSTKLANDGYYTRFTDAYTAEMNAAAGAGSAAGASAAIPDDETLLEQSLAAYESSLPQLPPEPRAAVEAIVAVGRSGVTYPVFLRRVEEEGLLEAMAGTVTPSRETLQAAVDHARSTVDPRREAEAAALLTALLAAGEHVDPFSFELERFRIASEHAPGIALRDAIVARLPRLLDLVLEWLDAHTSWAAADDRFKGASDAETQRNIERARECHPGFYTVRAAQFAAMFGPQPWWERPELAEERAGGRILWTDARLALALDAIPACVPLAAAPDDLVARAEAFGANQF